MKTPYYVGALLAAQHHAAHHTSIQDDDELRERMLEHRLADRDDVRDIYVVTCPVSDQLSGPRGVKIVEQASKRSKSDLSWAMHWAIQVGDQYFELQRGHYDPTRTGLRMSKWTERQQNSIIRRYRQGRTAMTDEEIRSVGDKHFSRLNKMQINKYDLWCNNCQIAVLNMLRDIGGLAYYQTKLESLHEWIREFFRNSILVLTRAYYRHRGCDEDVIIKHEKVLKNTLDIMSSRSIHYPKRQWIRADISEADGVVKKMGTIKDHWLLTILESSLSLRKGAENAYVRRGSDGKPELNFDAVREAVKGIFDDDEKGSIAAAWLKAIPWLTAGFLVGTPRWAFAVMSIAVQQVSTYAETTVDLKGGMEQSLIGIGVSPKLQDSQFVAGPTSKPRASNRGMNVPRKVKPKKQSIDSRLIARYERRLTESGVPYYIDLKDNTQSWDAPDQQEMCLRISNPPLSRRWDEKQDGDRIVYVHRITGETVDDRPGVSEIWAVKKRLTPDWVKSTFMALPSGWEMRRADDGERFYLNHNIEPPSSTTYHPMRRDIESERQVLLPEWNVEWDDERGKKYRNLQNGEIRWKAIDGPKCVSYGDKAKSTSRKPQQGFVEPLPSGWTLITGIDGEQIYKNTRDGRERTTHPLSDKRRVLLPDWEMRYTPGNRRYWVHYGHDGRGTSWWTRNRLLKNTTLKNNASGWKLAKNHVDWEWFEGGDVTHGEVPVLDLNDPAEIEFREYPFLLPDRLVDADGNFVEPLPADWVRRLDNDGSVYYWNFTNGARSDQHPNEEERNHLPALWEMRYTRHGRRYFVHHDTGNTWWTHPHEHKHLQVLRASKVQSQNGWRQVEGGRTWERFIEHPNMSMELQSINSTPTGKANETGSYTEEEGTDTWRSFNFTKDWLKTISSNVTQLQDQTRALTESDSLPQLGQWLVKNTQRKMSRDKQVDGNSESSATQSITEEPFSSPETPGEGSSISSSRRTSWARTSTSLLKLARKKSSIASSADLSLPGEQVPEEEPQPPEDGLAPTYMDSPGTAALSEEPLAVADSTISTDKSRPKPWARTTSNLLKIAKKKSSTSSSNDTTSQSGEPQPQDASQFLQQGLGLIYTKGREFTNLSQAKLTQAIKKGSTG